MKGKERRPDGVRVLFCVDLEGFKMETVFSDLIYILKKSGHSLEWRIWVGRDRNSECSGSRWWYVGGAC